jgi:acyl-coenzyme A synthetase/AMP-(fatty) acid ligase
MAAYKKIRQVVFVTEIPKTRVGKILKRLLKENNQGGF